MNDQQEVTELTRRTNSEKLKETPKELWITEVQLLFSIHLRPWEQSLSYNSPDSE